MMFKTKAEKTLERMFEIGQGVAGLKAKNEALEKENKFLRELLLKSPDVQEKTP